MGFDLEDTGGGEEEDTTSNAVRGISLACNQSSRMIRTLERVGAQRYWPMSSSGSCLSCQCSSVEHYKTDK
eukprot:scaffold29610_cov170-Skeletonema_dohrnii-CCMP3373.AAC.2